MAQINGLFFLMASIILLSSCRPSAGQTDKVHANPLAKQSHQALSGAVMPGFAPAGDADLFGLTTYDQWSIGDPGTFLYDATEDALKIVTAYDATNVDGWQANYISPSVSLQAGHRYQIIVRLKADVFPRGQNVVIKARSPDGSRNIEVGWNVSKANEWEDVILPAYANIDGIWTVRIWTYPTRYAETSSTIFIDPDLDAFELPFGREVVPRTDIEVDSDKQAFASSTERVDGLGNFYIKASDTWQHVFPKMMYRGTDQNYTQLFTRYTDYGFNGVMDIWTAEQAQSVLDAGLSYVSINATPTVSDWRYIDQVYNWASDGDHHQSIIWYNYDNENDNVANYTYQQALAAHVDADHLDPMTGGRRHPIYYLNGQYGLPRTYLNDSRQAMDITGSYVGTGGVGEASAGLVKPSLAVQFATQNQRAPVTVIQLQINLEEGFIPSLFYGISMGGRALSMWRDGTTHGGVDPDFRNSYWAQAFKEEVSPRIDQMLPIIEQPHWTPWFAETDHFPEVRIGTRDYNGDGYLILSSFLSVDQNIQISLQGADFVEARDFFTDEHIADISAGQFTTTIGHFNHGYQVLKLLRQVQPPTDAGLRDSGTDDLGQQNDAAQNDAAMGNTLAFVSIASASVTEHSAIIHFILNQNAQGQVEYGTDTSYGLWNVKEESFDYADHSQPLINLSPATTYHYRVHAWDSQGHEVISPDHSFTTLGTEDAGIVDSSTAQDASATDTTAIDAGGSSDAGQIIDAQDNDAEIRTDAGSGDLSESLDAQLVDRSLADASSQEDHAQTSDAGANLADQGHQVAKLNPESGCNCASQSGDDTAAGLWLALFGLLAVVSKRYAR